MGINLIDKIVPKNDAFVGMVDLKQVIPTNMTSTATGYTALTTDDVIHASATIAPITVTLYTAVGNNGRKLTIAKTDSTDNGVGVDGNASELINGNVTVVIQYPNNSMQLISDNAGWRII